jgi:hypothetical protein
MKCRRKFVVVLSCLGFVLITIPAYGYSDPNTVGLLSQILMPLLITAGACVTFLRKSLADFIARLSRRLRRRSDASES